MIFHFHTKNVTFFPEDQDYFESTLSHLKKLLAQEEAKSSQEIEIRVNLEKNKHHSGNVFESDATLFCPHRGKFHAETKGENIKQCADSLYEKLKPQVKKFHDKHLSV